jgi:hypothetical protein
MENLVAEPSLPINTIVAFLMLCIVIYYGLNDK